MAGASNDADRAFGETLRTALEQSGLTAVELANRLAVTERSLRRYMSGERRPDETIVANWESTCAVPPGSLVDAYRALPPRRGGQPTGSTGKEVSADGSAARSEAGGNSGEGQRRGARIRWAITAVVGIVAIAVVVIVLALAGGDGGGDGDGGPTRGVVEAPRAQSPRPAKRKVVTVDNRVTRGLNMDEDPTLLRLTTKPWINCLIRECAIGGTERKSGETYDAAICQAVGDRTTNGDDTSAADDDNPNLHTSTRYYQVQLPDDTYGYVSEVWLAKRDRGGLGLPPC